MSPSDVKGVQQRVMSGEPSIVHKIVNCDENRIKSFEIVVFLVLGYLVLQVQYVFQVFWVEVVEVDFLLLGVYLQIILYVFLHRRPDPIHMDGTGEDIDAGEAVPIDV